MAQFLADLGVAKEHQRFVQGQRVSTINSLVEFARTQDRKPTTTNTDKLFHVANGVLDFTDGNPFLRPHSPQYPFRISSSVRYDPQAQCPRFLGELLAPALDQEDQRLLQTLFGGMLLGPNRAQKILLIRGTAGGGKSALISIIERILGHHKVAYLRPQSLNGRFETSAYLGRSVLVGKDVPGNALSEKGARQLKSLTGGDLVEGEVKYKQHRPQMQGNFHVVIVSNNHLRIALDGDEEAWERRLVVVAFNRERPQRAIAEFAEMLATEEGPGILNWLIAGALRYDAEFETSGRITMTAVQQQRVRNLLYNSASVRAFVEQPLRPAPEQDISSQELLDAYLGRCRQNEWQAVPIQKFQGAVADDLLSRHNVHQRHDVLRGEAARSGATKGSPWSESPVRPSGVVSQRGSRTGRTLVCENFFISNRDKKFCEQK